MNIIATSCAICGRSLRDPLSVEIGIGPDCRKGRGFEDQDAEADWGSALRALGNDCPADLYDVVIDAHGVRKGHGDEIDTTKADAAKAIRGIGTGLDRRPGLCWYLATALERDVSREGVLRIILAINQLGYTKLASALARGLYVRKDYARRYGACVAYVQRLEVPEIIPLRSGKTLAASWKVEASYNASANNALRRLGGTFVNDARARKKFWVLDASATARTIFDGLRAADGMDLIAGSKGVTSPRSFPNPEPADRPWWDEPCMEEDRVCWVNEHGELVRYAIPGEPPTRPGLEKVPAEFFSRVLPKAVGS